MANKYKDIDLDFIMHPSSGDINTKSDVEAVKRSVRQLVLTNKYERPFQPYLYSGIRALLFEPLSPITAFSIKQQITDVIKRYEPRARMLTVSVETDDANNAFKASIYFRVTNEPEPALVNIVLKRLR